MAASEANGGEVEVKLRKLKRDLDEMPRSLATFSLCMRSLYAGNAVGTNSSAAKKFRKLRDDTRNDAMVYLNGVLPTCVRFVASLSEWFEYYVVLDYDVWCERLEDILEETSGYKQICEALLQMHKDMLIPLKKREDQAHLIVQELKDLKMEFEIRKKELLKSADTKAAWATGLLFVPFVNAIASPILFAKAETDTAKAVSKSAEAKTQEAAALTVEQCLIPALKSFIEGVQDAAGFFQVMEVELGQLTKQAESGIESRKRFHYHMMKAEAMEIGESCKEFFQIIPVVETDLKAIPIEGTDVNYVDRWLKKQIEIIEKKCTVGKLVKGLVEEIAAAGARVLLLLIL